jgi:hypothetical protein
LSIVNTFFGGTRGPSEVLEHLIGDDHVKLLRQRVLANIKYRIVGRGERTKIQGSAPVWPSRYLQRVEPLWSERLQERKTLLIQDDTNPVGHVVTRHGGNLAQALLKAWTRLRQGNHPGRQHGAIRRRPYTTPD